MTDTCWIVALTGTGGALELAGLLLVVKEIRSERQAAKDLFKEDAVVRPATVEMNLEVHSPSAQTDNDYLSPEEPDVSSADAYDLKFRLLGELTTATRADLQRVIAQEAAALSRQDKERDVALRRFLHILITGSLKDRVIGVILIAAGITCTTVAGIWGALS